MSFKQISALEAKDLIGDFPHDQMMTYIIPDPIDSRLGPEKLKEKAETVIKRDIGFGESFFFTNKALNHFKIIYKDENGIDMMEKKLLSGKLNIPPVKSMHLKDLLDYIEGNPVLH